MEQPGSGAHGRTIGQVLGGLPATTAVALFGLALQVLGSIGPWVTFLTISVAGTKGDGRYTLGLAIFAALMIATRNRAALWFAVLAGGAATATAAYDTVHIEHATSRVSLFGATASAGWGVYVTLIGAAVALVAMGIEVTRD